MNDFEEGLRSRLSDRADGVAVTIDLDDVMTGERRSAPRSIEQARSRIRLLTAAAAVLLVAGGVVALMQFRSVDAPSDATQQPTPTDPYLGLSREGPTLTDHWHVPYGVKVCGEWIELAGDLESGSSGGPTSDGYGSSGIHSHDDGLIHIHPFGSAGTGTNATLETFLTNYGVELTDDTLSFPPTQADGRQVSEVDAACDGGDASLAVIVWPDPEVATNKVIVTEQLAGTPLGTDGIVMALAFTDDPSSVEMPPSVIDAEENARIDG